MRRSKQPICYLALTVNAASTALGCKPEFLRAEILAGRLGPLYKHGVSTKLLVSDIEHYVRTYWKHAAPRKTKTIKTENT
jgi:hypothetical protein